MESNAENSICKALSNRIHELFPFGIQNVWMKAVGRDRYHVTNILGISLDEWDLAIPFSGLFRRENQLKCDVWSMKLKLKVEFNDFVTSDEFGKRDQCKWFRFVGPLNPSAERSSRKRHSSTIFEADTCLLLIPCYLQGESYLDRRQCDRSIKRFLRARNDSVYYRKTTRAICKRSQLWKSRCRDCSIQHQSSTYKYCFS